MKATLTGPLSPALDALPSAEQNIEMETAREVGTFGLAVRAKGLDSCELEGSVGAGSAVAGSSLLVVE